jgi:hypothetical protein
VLQWQDTSAGPCNGCDGPDAIAVDPAGNVYQTGPVGSTIVTYKYNSAGVQQWMQTYNSGMQNYSSSIGLDSAGNVYVGGSSTVSPDAGGYLVVKYNNSGVQQWASAYNRSGNFYDRLVAMVVDKAGNSYTTGYSQTGTDIGTADYATVKYNSAGVKQWEIVYNGPVDSTDIPTAIILKNSDVLVTGYSVGPTHTYDFLTIKYAQTITGKSNPSSNAPVEFSLSQNYPNPFNPKTIISYQLPVSNHVKLTIYDVMGREAAVLVNHKQNAGSYEVEWDGENFASGVYYYMLTAGDFKDTKRMVLVK